MANPRQRRAAKSGVKVARKSRTVNLRRIVINEPTIQAAWDSTKTVQENFKTIGLASKLNGDIGSSHVRRKVLQWSGERERVLDEICGVREAAAEKAKSEGVLDMTPLDLGEEAIFGQLNAIFESTSDTPPSPTTVVQELESKSTASALLSKSKKLSSFKRLSEDDVEYIENLIKKYGEAASVLMARDLKLNYNQHTPKKLESMIEIYYLMKK